MQSGKCNGDELALIIYYRFEPLFIAKLGKMILSWLKGKFTSKQHKNTRVCRLTKPFSVGSTSVHRGVISTCNYIAREYGVHSAMSVKEALQKCPSLILLPVSMGKYKKASSVIRKIFYSLTGQVEPLSLDEAYLDVTHVKKFSNSATWIAAWLKDAIYQATGLTSSVGVAPNKLLAKLASDMNKPNGITKHLGKSYLVFFSVATQHVAHCCFEIVE